MRLQAQPFQLLVMLLERPGELVTREEICQKLWPADTFVDFDRSLGTAVNKIREVLNDSAAEPRFIETLPRRGYRFIAPVLRLQTDLKMWSLRLHQHRNLIRNGRIIAVHVQRSLVWIGVCVVLVVAALVAWYLVSPPSSPVDRSPPLANLSTDPNQQFFADGVTDELTTNLAQIASLRVISHTSAVACWSAHKSASEIARCLGVDALVEGSVIRSGDRVRINTQLIHAASDRHLWAHTYDLQLMMS